MGSFPVDDEFGFQVVSDTVQTLLYSLGEKMGDLPTGTVDTMEIADGEELVKYR